MLFKEGSDFQELEGNDCQEFINKVLKEAGGSVEGIAEWILDQVRSGNIENLRKTYMCFMKDSEPEKRFPNFEESGAVTKNALVLIILYLAFKNYALRGSREASPWVSKKILDNLIGGDSQQARHLPRNYGFKIISSKKYKIYQANPSGVDLPPPPSLPRREHWYTLADLRLGNPSPHRKLGVTEEEFEKIKKTYNYRCATCGAEEGKLHYNPYYDREIVQLQKGHMNPLKELEPGNIIPQCQFCNRAYRNWLVFDRNGRTIGVADWVFVIRSLKEGYLSGEIPPDFWEIIRKVAGQRSLDQNLKGGSE